MEKKEIIIYDENPNFKGFKEQEVKRILEAFKKLHNNKRFT